ncbi:hypothetical protein FQA39_LY08894 [Lamprigera yunnana]|nr:hypothetical protein FQA39_LY08894 [Lamprigera yunnana]
MSGEDWSDYSSDDPEYEISDHSEISDSDGSYSDTDDDEDIPTLKPLVNYRLELVRSSGLKEFYDNIVECVIMQKSKREDIRRMAGINVYLPSLSKS